MTNASEIRRRTNFYAAHLLITALVILFALAFIFRLPALQNLRIPSLYLLPIAILYCVVLAFIIARKGAQKAPLIPLLVGGVVIVGGTLFDMIATVTVSPNLSLETNLFARLLLDSGHSLSFVYGYAIVTQLLLALLFCILWAAFLRHRQTLLTLIWASKPQSQADFIKAAFGGEGYSWRVFFAPKFNADYYRRAMYHSVLFLGFMLPVFNLYRWSLGAEWFNIVPNLADNTIAIFFVALGAVLYLVWLSREYARGASRAVQVDG